MASAIKPVNVLLAKSASPEVKAYLLVRRRFDYAALIIALYASFERFVEEILTSYTRIISQQERYGLLPQGLITKHLTKTAELLSKGKIDDFRYPGLTSNQLVENLHLCLSDAWPYELNHVAVTAHDRNIRFDELGKLLGLVDLSHDAVRHAQPLVQWYLQDQDLSGAPPASVPTTVIHQRLDQFVERRNDVAHRGGNPSDRLGVDDMQSLVEFIHALSASIFTLFVSQYFVKVHVGKAGCEQLRRVEGPFNKQSVWVVERPTSVLYINQPVFALSTGFLTRWGRIQSLRINDTDHVFVTPDENEAVGVQFDFRAPESAQVYILGSEDETIWTAVNT